MLNLPNADVQTIEFGALLHDLGKLSIDPKIRAKSENLSIDEQVWMEMHTMVGKSILDSVAFLQPAIPIVLSHHERWDGMGYPEGLSGEQIPLLARIVTLANGLDHAMNTDSLKPLSLEAALETLSAEAGRCYRPGIGQGVDRHGAIFCHGRAGSVGSI